MKLLPQLKINENASLPEGILAKSSQLDLTNLTHSVLLDFLENVANNFL